MKQIKLSLLALSTLLMAGLGQQEVLAANVVVTTSADSGAGSLRDAITNANPGDRILFDATIAGQTISLLSDLPDVDRQLILDGETLNITISGSTVARSGFVVTGTGNVTVRKLTFINGSASSGGAFRVVFGGFLSVYDSTFTNNIASSAGGSGEGGAVDADGNLQIFDSQFNNNQSDDYGGAVFIDRADFVTIEHSTFSGNSALDNGGAVYVDRAGPVTILATTFDSNTADDKAGALYVSRIKSPLTVRNSTLKYNSTTDTESTLDGGGAIYVSSNLNDTLTLVENSTFVGNSVASGGGAAIHNRSNLELNNVTVSDSENTNDSDGAVYNDGDVLIRNSIIANTIGTTDCEHRDIPGNSIVVEDSLIENPDSDCSVSAANGNITGSDPLLGALDGTNSFTEVLPLQSGSPAIDEGEDATCAAADQRAIMRTGTCDMGAYEKDATDRCFATHDNGSTVFSSADLSADNVIADAIGAASANDTVKLAGLCLAASPGNPVTTPLLAMINKNLTLRGGYEVGNWGTSNSAEFPTVIDGRDAVRSIDISGGLAVTLRDLTLQNSKISSSGAAINMGATGTVTLRDMMVRHNEVTSLSNRGAGLYNSGTASVIIIDSVFDGNIAANGAALYNTGGIVLMGTSTFANGYANNRGGAVYHAAGSFSAETSTFFNNIARNNGGAIYTLGMLDMENSTVSGNSASIGGGIDLANSAVSMTLTNLTLHKNAASSASGSNNGAALRNAGTATIHNTILSGSVDGTDCVSSGTLTLEFSLVEDGSCNAAAGTGNQTGDPELRSLDDNGGTTLTHRLQAGSSAMNNGTNDLCPSEDQRGVTRSDASCDMGAYEERDTDGDGSPDSSDSDDDDDGMTDVFENANGLNPLNAGDADLDPDLDGLTNLQEFLKDPGLDVDNPDTDGDEIQDNIDNNPVSPSNLCGGVDANLSSSIVDSQQCATSNSVTIQGTAEVTVTGSLEVISLQTGIEPGFHVDGELSIMSGDPCPVCP